MKKYLLSLLVVPLLLVGGYSSAYSTNYTYDCTESNNYCYIINQNSQHFLNNVKSIELLSVPDGLSYIGISISMSAGGTATPDKFRKIGDVVNIDGNVYSLNIWGEGVYTFKITYPDPPLVPGGVSGFTPVITGLTNSINEFIPYVVYIGLGVLGALIGFVAIKRLINWVRRKIFSSFK